MADQFIGMYVNDYTLDYGETGRRAIHEFLARGHAAGLDSRAGRAGVCGISGRLARRRGAISKSMKAIRVSKFGKPGVLELEEIADHQPQPGQLLVRLHAVGVNPVEAYVRAGTYPRLPGLPYTPGTDGAGVVEAGEAGGFKKGGRVYLIGSLTGTYAELALCTPEQVRALPHKISFEQGAAIGVPYGTAYRALVIRGQAQAGETVLVHGASGGVGTAAVQLAKAAGVRVFGTAGSEEGLELVRRNGAEAAFNHREEGYLEQIKKVTEGLDLILEMAADQNLGKDLALLKPRGRVVVVGSRGPVQIDAREAMMRDADIRGMSLLNAGPEEREEIHGAIDRELAEGKISPVIGAAFPLAEAAEAHEKLTEAGAAGKVVLKM